jgi:hypothetical protein
MMKSRLSSMQSKTAILPARVSIDIRADKDAPPAYAHSGTFFLDNTVQITDTIEQHISEAHDSDGFEEQKVHPFDPPRTYDEESAIRSRDKPSKNSTWWPLPRPSATEEAVELDWPLSAKVETKAESSKRR